MKSLLLFALIGLTLSLSEKRQTVVDCAISLLGTPYEKIDCSGLTRRCYGKVGITLSTIAHLQFYEGIFVTRAELKPGDLVGFNNHDGKTQPGHVGIFIGGNKYIHSPGRGKVITYGNLDTNKNFIAGRKYLD